MNDLREYILAHSQRGPCRCGRCVDVATTPDRHTTGHAADLVFFQVTALPSADAGALRELIRANSQGEFCDLNLFDGVPHSYAEVGGWIGDQGLALQFMGLGSLLNLWQLITPRVLLGDRCTEAQAKTLAEQGFLSLMSAQPKPV